MDLDVQGGVQEGSSTGSSSKIGMFQVHLQEAREFPVERASLIWERNWHCYRARAKLSHLCHCCHYYLLLIQQSWDWHTWKCRAVPIPCHHPSGCQLPSSCALCLWGAQMNMKNGWDCSWSWDCNCSRGSRKTAFLFVKTIRFDLKVLERGWLQSLTETLNTLKASQELLTTSFLAENHRSVTAAITFSTGTILRPRKNL